MSGNRRFPEDKKDSEVNPASSQRMATDPVAMAYLKELEKPIDTRFIEYLNADAAKANEKFSAFNLHIDQYQTISQTDSLFKSRIDASRLQVMKCSASIDEKSAEDLKTSINWHIRQVDALTRKNKAVKKNISALQAQLEDAIKSVKDIDRLARQQHVLGLIHEFGPGVAHNLKKAKKYYIAAKGRVPAAHTSLGLLAVRHAANNDAGIPDFKSAGEEATAKFYLGVLAKLKTDDKEDKDLKQDIEHAFDYFSQAGVLGSSQANVGIGYMLPKIDNGSIYHPEMVFSLYVQAAEHGDSRGMVNLGLCYLHGEGVEKNNEQAIYYFRLALLADSSEQSKQFLMQQLRDVDHPTPMILYHAGMALHDANYISEALKDVSVQQYMKAEATQTFSSLLRRQAEEVMMRIAVQPLLLNEDKKNGWDPRLLRADLSLGSRSSNDSPPAAPGGPDRKKQ